MNDFFTDSSPTFFNFVIVTLLALIIGLEQRRHHEEQEEPAETLFGTDRTFTFIGILGFILFTLDPVNKILFIGGGLIISSLLAIFYFNKIHQQKRHGLTSILSALITYCLAPLVITQPQWLTLLIVVTVLIFTEMKEEFLQISKKFGKDEFITLAKFILIAGIILPNLPDRQVFSFIQLSPYKMWLAIVIGSGISYFSYLLQKFVFTKSGIIVAGILGGLYSSTAVSLIFSRKSNDKIAAPHEYASAILFATAVMYVRVFLIILIIQPVLAFIILPYLVLFLIISLLTGVFILRMKEKSDTSSPHDIGNGQNPLEFRVALVFAAFYVLFSFITHYTESHYGESGLNLLSFLAGLADVDSYIMNLLQGKFAVTDVFMVSSIIAATTANNLIKAVYSVSLAEKKTRHFLMIGFAAIIIVNIAAIIIMKSIN